jgi:hypothetical protein
MYSGTTLSNYSGNLVGTHQKINRLSRRKLGDLTSLKHFPNNRLLLHFEGRNGPDGIKSKSPGQNEPWHFFDPYDPDDDDLLGDIRDHFDNLVFELKERDLERAAFEAAWLSHALVDGLTPAHHYPFEEELATLRLGEGNATRVTLRDKLTMKGDSRRETIKNNWKMWGIKGLMTTHAMFEGGVAAIVAPLRYHELQITKHDVNHMKELGIEEYFKQTARQIALLDLYDKYYKYGWTTKLAREVREDLMPPIIKTVTCAWYLALTEAGLAGRAKG